MAQHNMIWYSHSILVNNTLNVRFSGRPTPQTPSLSDCVQVMSEQKRKTTRKDRETMSMNTTWKPKTEAMYQMVCGLC